MSNGVQTSWRTRRFLIWLGLFSGVAIMLRLIVCVELSAIPSVTSPPSVTDMATYKQLAQEILAGKFPEVFYYQPFYYAVFLPCVYFFCGAGAWAPMILQSILGGACAWFTGLIAARIFGRTAGLVAAVLVALARQHIFHTPFLLFEVLQSFWLILLTWLVLQAVRSRHFWYWPVIGLLTSVTILTRGNALLLVPFILAMFVWTHRHSGWLRLFGGIVLIIALIEIPQLPFAIHNFQHSGKWTGPSTAQNAVLALGNTQEAPAGGLTYPLAYREWLRRAELPAPEGQSITGQVLNWLHEEPLAWPELKLRMLLLFWNRVEIPNNINIDYAGRDSLVLQSPLLADFAVIGVFALLGLFTCGRLRSPARLYLYANVITLCLAVLLFYILARFRVPLVPLLCIFAGAAIARLITLCRRYFKHRPIARQILFKQAIACAAAVFITLQGYHFYQLFVEAKLLRIARPLGVTVNTPALSTVYDHGPIGIGGWAPLPISNSGTVLRKEFVTENIRQMTLGATPNPVVLRIPVSGMPGGELELQVVCSGSNTARNARYKLSPEADRQIDWIEIPLDCPNLPLTGKFAVTLWLRPVGNTSAAVCIDKCRNYFRTFLPIPPDGHWQAADAEAALELDVHWTPL